MTFERIEKMPEKWRLVWNKTTLVAHYFYADKVTSLDSDVYQIEHFDYMGEGNEDVQPQLGLDFIENEGLNLYVIEE